LLFFANLSKIEKVMMMMQYTIYVVTGHKL